MTVTLKFGVLTRTIDALLAFDWTRPSGTVQHELVNGDKYAVTMRPAGPRRGVFKMLLLTEARALVVDDSLARAEVFTLTDTERPALTPLRFVTVGQIVTELDPVSFSAWTVEVGFLEVPE